MFVLGAQGEPHDLLILYTVMEFVNVNEVTGCEGSARELVASDSDHSVASLHSSTSTRYSQGNECV